METGFLSMDILSVVMQKQSQGSEELSVQIVSADGEVIKEQTTTAPFGVVSITADPTELQGS